MTNDLSREAEPAAGEPAPPEDYALSVAIDEALRVAPDYRRRVSAYGAGEPAPTPRTEPERLLIIPVLTTEEGDRHVLVRWPDWPHPALLAMDAPSPHDNLEDAVATLLRARLGLRPTEPPRPAPERLPVRMPHPRLGLTGATGWLRPVAVPCEPAAPSEDGAGPAPDALLAGCDLLPLDAAIEALSTDLERAALRAAVGVG